MAGAMNITSSVLSGSRRRRITVGAAVSTGLGLIGLPLVVVAVWPTFDHSPWDVNTMVLAAGVGLSAISWAFGRGAVAAITEESRTPVEPPSSRPWMVAGGALVVAILCLVIAVSSAA